TGVPFRLRTARRSASCSESVCNASLMERIALVARFASSRMKPHLILSLLALAVMPVSAENNTPPKGFTALFNGKDLSGWYGWSTKDPTELWSMTEEQRAEY